MMATACVLSSLEVEGEEEVGEWDHQERDMAPRPGARTTELLCPVGDVCSSLWILKSPHPLFCAVLMNAQV